MPYELLLLTQDSYIDKREADTAGATVHIDRSEKMWNERQQSSTSLGLIITPDFKNMESKKLLEEFDRSIKALLERNQILLRIVCIARANRSQAVQISLVPDLSDRIRKS